MTDAESRRSRLRVAIVPVAALALLAAVALSVAPVDLRSAVAAFQAFRQAAADAVLRSVPWPPFAQALATWTRGVVLAPHLFLPLGVILLLEWAAPAARGQRLLSPALLNDFFWYLAEIGFFLVITASLAATLGALYDAHLGFLTVGALAASPAWSRLGLAVLVSDFLDWVHHLVRHKVPALWWFHTVHHSQRHLNAWTNERVHVVEYLVSTTIRFVPAAALQVSTQGIVAYVLVAAWYTRLYHANIRSNFGVLRFVLVTPQSHRVHHSARPEHQDKNFGVLFSVWDRLFGTQCRDCDVYPETGIEDPTFPHERRWGDTLSLRAFLAQQLYPLRLAGRWVRRAMA